tara:strand:+ start:399 stop:1259 length:861 start_codon:yes stop_codon:yes gene_type:complete
MNKLFSATNRAKLLMIFSALSFSLMAAVVKATPHSVAVKSFSRQILSCMFVLFIILLNNYRIIPLKKNRMKLLLRCLFGTLGIYLYFYSIDYLILANASMLTRLSPFFVTLFAAIILKENVNSMNWLIFIPMVIGCIFIIKPTSDVFSIISIYAVLSACSGALAYIMIKSIGKDESAYVIIFWFTFFSSIVYFVIASKELLILEEIQYFSLFFIGVLGFIGQVGLTFSYQISKASKVAPYSYSYILFAGIIGYIIWNEIPDKFSMIGYILIILSYILLIKFQKNSK